MSRLNRKGPSMMSWWLPWTQDVLAPEPWICYLWPKQNLRHQVPQWQRLCSIHLCASLPLLSLHPDLVQCLPWSRPRQRRCSCLHVSVPIMDVCALCHTQFPLPLHVETVPILIWKFTHLRFSVSVVLGEMILPQARCDVWSRPPKEITAFLTNWVRKGVWLY